MHGLEVTGGVHWKLEALLAEAATARAARSLSRCVEAVEAGLGDDVGALAAIAPMVRSLDGLQRLAFGPIEGDMDVASLVERVATAQLVASSTLSLLRTRIPPLPATAPAAGLRSTVSLTRSASGMRARSLASIGSCFRILRRSSSPAATSTLTAGSGIKNRDC